MPKLRCSYQLHIQLCETKPAVWRRVVVADTTTLAQLHQTIQAVMGWPHATRYGFDIANQRYGLPNPDQPDDPTMDARRYTVGQLLQGKALPMRYAYGAGNLWLHRIKLEACSPIGSPAALTSLPMCLGGRNACPPVITSNAAHYQRLLDAHAQGHIDPTFDPKHFDVQEAQQRVHALQLLRASTVVKTSVDHVAA